MYIEDNVSVSALKQLLSALVSHLCIHLSNSRRRSTRRSKQREITLCKQGNEHENTKRRMENRGKCGLHGK